VLFEFVSGFSDDQLTLADPAEAAFLWDLCCQLEGLLAEPLATAWRPANVASFNPYAFLTPWSRH